VKLVHVCLEIAQLRKDLAAVAVLQSPTTIELTLILPCTSTWLGRGSLSVGPLANVSSLMGPEVAQLRECLPARRHGTRVWLLSSMRTKMDLEMCWLRKRFGTFRIWTQMLLWFIGGGACYGLQVWLSWLQVLHEGINFRRGFGDW